MEASTKEDTQRRDNKKTLLSRSVHFKHDHLMRGGRRQGDRNMHYRRRAILKNGIRFGAEEDFLHPSSAKQQPRGLCLLQKRNSEAPKYCGSRGRINTRMMASKSINSFQGEYWQKLPASHQGKFGERS